MSLDGCFNIGDLRKKAKRRLPAPIFHYIDGGADDEVTLRRNTSAFDDYELVPDYLVDVSKIDTRTKLLGLDLDWSVERQLIQKGGQPVDRGGGFFVDRRFGQDEHRGQWRQRV